MLDDFGQISSSPCLSLPYLPTLHALSLSSQYQPPFSAAFLKTDKVAQEVFWSCSGFCHRCRCPLRVPSPFMGFDNWKRQPTCSRVLLLGPYTDILPKAAAPCAWHLLGHCLSGIKPSPNMVPITLYTREAVSPYCQWTSASPTRTSFSSSSYLLCCGSCCQDPAGIRASHRGEPKPLLRRTSIPHSSTQNQHIWEWKVQSTLESWAARPIHYWSLHAGEVEWAQGHRLLLGTTFPVCCLAPIILLNRGAQDSSTCPARRCSVTCHAWSHQGFLLPLGLS